VVCLEAYYKSIKVLRLTMKNTRSQLSNSATTSQLDQSVNEHWHFNFKFNE